MGFIHGRLGEAKAAREALAIARALGAGAKGSRGAGKRPAKLPDVSGETLLHSFFGAARQRRIRPLTGGDARLAALLREDALEQVGYGTLTPAR